jgi:tetratricopeptide (TPR) repeat protein
VYAKDQFPYVQGSLIDWGKEGEKSGFKVTSPKQTKENREKTVKWMNEESEKRLKQIREDIDERIARLRKLTSHDPNNELAHFELAKLLMDDSKYAEAVKSFDRVLVIAPDLAKTYPLLGRCLVELKQKDRATEVLKKGRAVAEKQGDKAVCTTIEGLLTEMKDPAPQDAE